MLTQSIKRNQVKCKTAHLPRSEWRCRRSRRWGSWQRDDRGPRRSAARRRAWALCESRRPPPSAAPLARSRGLHAHIQRTQVRPRKPHASRMIGDSVGTAGKTENVGLRLREWERAPPALSGALSLSLCQASFGSGSDLTCASRIALPPSTRTVGATVMTGGFFGLRSVRVFERVRIDFIVECWCWAAENNYSYS